MGQLIKLVWPQYDYEVTQNVQIYNTIPVSRHSAVQCTVHLYH